MKRGEAKYMNLRHDGNKASVWVQRWRHCLTLTLTLTLTGSCPSGFRPAQMQLGFQSGMNREPRRLLGHLQYQRQYLSSGRQPRRCSALRWSPRVGLLDLGPMHNMLFPVTPSRA